MAVRNVSKTFTLEQQRQEINLIGADLGDISSLNTPLPNTLTRAINYLDETVSSYEGTVWYVTTEGVDSLDENPESPGYRKNPGRTRNCLDTMLSVVLRNFPTRCTWAKGQC